MAKRNPSPRDIEHAKKKFDLRQLELPVPIAIVTLIVLSVFMLILVLFVIGIIPTLIMLISSDGQALFQVFSWD